MNPRTLLLSFALATLGGQVALAHPEHDHAPKRAPAPAPTKKADLDEAAAKARAQEEIARLLSVKKIDASWKEASRFDAIKKSGDATKWEWLVTFDNAQVKENKRLYIFLKPSGEFVAANFTGK